MRAKDYEKKLEALTQIEVELDNLKKSSLYKFRVENKYRAVLGQGSLSANIVFIGEAPGKNEAITGKPFCGASGKLLDELLKSISIKRDDVYITNIVKDRPPENRDPSPEEINIYAPFLDRQIQIIKPKIIATLGRYSMKYIFERLKLLDYLGPISKVHGKVFDAKTEYGKIKVIPLYHPAAAIYNQHLKSTLVSDFKKLNN